MFSLNGNPASKGTNFKGKFQGNTNANVNVIELETSNAQFNLHVDKRGKTRFMHKKKQSKLFNKQCLLIFYL